MSATLKPSQQCPPSLELKGLGKQYAGGFWGLREFSALLQPGITGILGPNGAGKSTLLRMLATLSTPSAGEICWKGERVPTGGLHWGQVLRERLGYLPQDFGVYPQLNAIEFLGYLAAAKGLSPRSARARIDDLIALLNLQHCAKQALGGYSGGMRQRVGIAQALLNDPELLILDEPTIGLDLAERAAFRHLLAELAQDRIILLSTHIVSDLEATAEDILMMAGGRLIARDSAESLAFALQGQVWLWTVPFKDVEALRQRWLVAGMLKRPQGMQLRVLSPVAPHIDARAAEPNLEDAYLWATRPRSAEAEAA